MIPYFQPIQLKFGPFTLHAFGFLVFVAVLVGRLMMTRRSRRQGLDQAVASRLWLWMIAGGFVGAHLMKVLTGNPGRALENPLVFLRIWEGLYSFGGLMGGLLGAAYFSWRRHLAPAELWRYLDVTAYAFPFAWIFGRLGCTLAHDHPGVPSTSWLAVPYPGGPRYDLGLLEFLYTLLLAGVFAGLDRRRWPAGFYFGLLFALYGLFRFALDGWNVPQAKYFGWSADRWFAAAAALAGVFTMAALTRRAWRGRAARE